MSGEKARLEELRAKLAELDRRREQFVAEIAALMESESAQTPPVNESPSQSPHVGDEALSNAQKIALFRRLFRGRDDVFPARWENAKSGRSGYSPVCANEWREGICGKPRIKCSDCPHQAFVPVSDEMIARHLRGMKPDGAVFVKGVYPLLPDDSCWFLAADFDDEGWRDDVAAFARTCRRHDIPVAVERSRSGEGAHAWIFFDQPTPAALARRLGSFLITETMEDAPDIGFKSYDRLFPSQDVLPAGGFGNLIALPLQGLARQSGNSVFLDDAFSPYPDQWAFLAQIAPISRRTVERLVEQASAAGKILGVKIPLVDDDEEPWLAPPSRRPAATNIVGTLPATVKLTLGDQIYIPRDGLPSSFVARLIRIAAFQNPEFYAAQAARRSTHDKPRIISCAELSKKFVALPRGCFEAVEELFRSHGSAVEIEDVRFKGSPIDMAFIGTLRPDQQEAANALLAHDTGVLAATTAFGKTIVAISIMAARGLNTLILVHRQQLMDQWVERLSAFSNLPRRDIGVIGGGRRKPTGRIDVALMQSLVRKGEVNDIVGSYGHLVIDECHHISAVSFELLARRAKAKYVLGLSATVTRKDGHHPIIAMQCGPIRFRVDARSEAAKRPFDHLVRIRETKFRLEGEMSSTPAPIQEIFRALSGNAERNDLIFNDILFALEDGRVPVVITERTDHLEDLSGRLERFAKNVIVLRGGQTARQRRAAMDQLRQIAPDEERVVLATGRYLGEGFDDARLDTLFLTMPVAWKGTLAQYAGRLHRLHESKRDVVIYDYVDKSVPVLARMAVKRRLGYQALGYRIEPTREDLFSI
jgi:superfamily II DNA or RNA helicase